MNLRILAALGALALTIVAFAIAQTGDAPAPDPTAIPHLGSGDVQVRITAEPLVSRGQSPVLVQLESGEIPDGVTRLTVLTDENCQPDADGVSHCRNRVAFETATGPGEAALRHHHRMSEEPCLAPGQTIELVA